jgi:hypothetical protein
VCRNGGNGSNDGAMLTWDGTSMQTGAVDPDPRTGCGAVVDIAERTLLSHGGTLDSRVDTGALPTNVINILDVGVAAGDAWRSISATAPATVAHNSVGGPSQAGTAHYNPVLQQMVLHAAYTGALTSRATTLWRNDEGSSIGNLFGLRPFFDGLTSRLVDGGFERVLINNTWVGRTLPFTAPSEALSFTKANKQRSALAASKTACHPTTHTACAATASPSCRQQHAPHCEPHQPSPTTPPTTASSWPAVTSTCLCPLAMCGRLKAATGANCPTCRWVLEAATSNCSSIAAAMC